MGICASTTASQIVRIKNKDSKACVMSIAADFISKKHKKYFIKRIKEKESIFDGAFFCQIPEQQNKLGICPCDGFIKNFGQDTLSIDQNDFFNELHEFLFELDNHFNWTRPLYKRNTDTFKTKYDNLIKEWSLKLPSRIIKSIPSFSQIETATYTGFYFDNNKKLPIEVGLCSVILNNKYRTFITHKQIGDNKRSLTVNSLDSKQDKKNTS